MADTYKVALGPVQQRKIPYGDAYWNTFNSSFDNQELDQLRLAECLYNGHPITTWHGNHWRHSDNYLAGQHLGLDFDTEDARSTLATLAKDPFISKHGAILYTTPSHTPDAPRARAIFTLDVPIMQAKNYGLAASALLWIFGTADRQAKDAVRFFYGGRPGACEMDWIGNVLSLDLVKDLIRRYQETGTQTRRKTTRTWAPQTVDEREIVDALKHVNPWQVSYDEWVAILMAIHSEMPGESGLALAETWADGKPKEVAQKWRGFRSDGNGAGKVGIGTLFAIAKEQGWAPGT